MSENNNKIKSISYKFGRFFYLLLDIFAVLNIFILFLPSFQLSLFQNEIYTKFSVLILILYLVFQIIYDPKFLQFKTIAIDFMIIVLSLTVENSGRIFQFYLLGRQTFYLIKKLSLGSNYGKFNEKFSDNSALLVIFTFMLTIFFGALLLMLPGATVNGKNTSLLGAFFTATSATCVTGLIIYDTGTHFTLFGQSIILFLIQIGGLGIMTISSAFAIMLGQKLSLKNESIIQNVVGESTKVDMFSLIKNVVIITFIFEILGALQLYFTFGSGLYHPAKAIYYSLFHSISAFCNAGFCLYENNLMMFRMNYNINFVVTTLIIIGGIGFPVMADIRNILRKKRSLNRLSLHSKIVLFTTVILIILGTIGFYISEFNAEMKNFSFLERIYSSYFQSVTTRTAGFNTIDNGNLSRGSVLLSVILMFIGASPGSTGGGIKTTALIVVIGSVLAMFRGSHDVNIFKRRVSDEIIRRVMALIAISITFVATMIFILLMIEPFSFEKIIFEAVSAFATVGLSGGITTLLSNYGKSIIILLMFFGRVGPLTLIYAIAAKKEKSTFKFVEEKISIG